MRRQLILYTIALTTSTKELLRDSTQGLIPSNTVLLSLILKINDNSDSLLHSKISYVGWTSAILTVLTPIQLYNFDRQTSVRRTVGYHIACKSTIAVCDSVSKSQRMECKYASKNLSKSTTEAITWRCSLRKVFLIILQNLQENTCARDFLIISWGIERDHWQETD